jgi:hypothetical protein
MGCGKPVSSWNRPNANALLRGFWPQGVAAARVKDEGEMREFLTRLGMSAENELAVAKRKPASPIAATATAAPGGRGRNIRERLRPK